MSSGDFSSKICQRQADSVLHTYERFVLNMSPQLNVPQVAVSIHFTKRFYTLGDTFCFSIGFTFVWQITPFSKLSPSVPKCTNPTISFLWKKSGKTFWTLNVFRLSKKTIFIQKWFSIQKFGLLKNFPVSIYTWFSGPRTSEEPSFKKYSAWTRRFSILIGQGQKTW